MAGEEIRGAGGRTHSLGEVARGRAMDLLRLPIRCCHHRTSDSLLVLRSKVPPAIIKHIT